MGNPNPPLSEMDVVAVVADLGELSKDIRFMHGAEFADRLDAIIAHRFGYVAVPIEEGKASA